ncbi:hypothetical protein [Arsenicitalea aurantiaca]|uniref:hypothetical protein n=1 Tax=Arsenicitalea aurantiaca TaxID=1783274 RepID=UPI00267D9A77
MSREDAKSVYAPRVVNQHHFCTRCGCTTYSITPDWSVGTPGDGDTRIAVNARLFDDFDLEAVRVKHLDGRTGW